MEASPPNVIAPIINMTRATGSITRDWEFVTLLF
jgi:hypothetical protein